MEEESLTVPMLAVKPNRSTRGRETSKRYLWLKENERADRGRKEKLNTIEKGYAPMGTLIQDGIEIKDFAFGPQPALPKVTIDQNTKR